MLSKKSLVYYSIFCHLSTFYQHEFEFGDRKIFPMGTFVCIHTDARGLGAYAQFRIFFAQNLNFFCPKLHLFWP